MPKSKKSTTKARASVVSKNVLRAPIPKERKKDFVK